MLRLDPAAPEGNPARDPRDRDSRVHPSIRPWVYDGLRRRVCGRRLLGVNVPRVTVARIIPAPASCEG
jgi:hypothetical protein